MQSASVNPVDAAEQLQTIRTLMERAALYRRALGPTFVAAGTLGVLAAAAGLVLPFGHSLLSFVVYWSAIALVAMVGTAFRVRQQALGAAEPLWTPPTKRVAAAMAPSLVVALVGTAYWVTGDRPTDPLSATTLPALWMAMHGLALHAAGHFTLRGIRWLGWAFVVAGLAFPAICWGLVHIESFPPTLRLANLAMGLTFGLGHLVAGARLMSLERRSSV